MRVRVRLISNGGSGLRRGGGLRIELSTSGEVEEGGNGVVVGGGGGGRDISEIEKLVEGKADGFEGVEVGDVGLG